MRSEKPVVAPLEIARWEGYEIRRFHVDGRPTWLFADLWRALGIPRPRAQRAIEPLIVGRHKWHIAVEGESGLMTALDAHGLEKLLGAAPIPEQAASLRRELLVSASYVRGTAEPERQRIPLDCPPLPSETLIVREYRGKQIRQRADGYLCLTDMDRAAAAEATLEGRSIIRLDNWRQRSSIVAFLMELGRTLDSRVLLEAERGAHVGGGITWAHPQVAIRFAIDVSPAFAVQVTAWVEDLRVRGFAVDERRPEGLRELIRSEVRAVLREEVAGVLREELPRRLPAPRPRREGTPLLPGEAVETADGLLLKRPPAGDYRNVTHYLRELQVPMFGKVRHQLGRKVAEAYRFEAPQHPDWPRNPILLQRQGNWYPRQTWAWLEVAVARIAGQMGYPARRLMPAPPEPRHAQSALFEGGRP